MPGPEATLEGNCSDDARGDGWLEIKLEKANKRGWPDHIYIHDPRLVWVEFKDEDEEPTRQQAKRHSELREHGQEVYVIKSRAEFRRVVLRR